MYLYVRTCIYIEREKVLRVNGCLPNCGVLRLHVSLMEFVYYLAKDAPISHDVWYYVSYVRLGYFMGKPRVSGVIKGELKVISRVCLILENFCDINIKSSTLVPCLCNEV